MTPALQALVHWLLHRRAPGHGLWSERLIWSGGGGRVWFCGCGAQFWPLFDGNAPPQAQGGVDRRRQR